MIFVLSPAKALDFERPSTTATHTQPDYLDDAAELIKVLRRLSPSDVAELMSLSDPLAVLNVARYETWAPPFSPENAKQAILAFNGDVYDGLNASTLSEAELAWAQHHVRILSGLYGLLRPLDLMQAYRLEMGSKLINPRGRTLYAFWGEKLAAALNQLIVAQRNDGGAGVLVNLASEEYFKAVKGRIDARVVTPVFEDWKGGRYKIISFYAKRARGAMCRFAITRKVETVDELKDFDGDGYAFAAEASDEDRLVFRRRLAGR